ncbi:hypothetical protein JQ629_10390 [Bradyrhizobium sp. AUGA SZCCT0222]|uniref:hypothetical protein n=1 Tax=Bradyrhizobium sp. AUGA SZCCT0222 TaxID=2807668 RepID=UPI001BA76099|nr:hypothetical protein [Bradyrhizobium sp. AUGA SZCCT0222]MBR1267913.1 hypothetical protein [Bradyrhizobium sp. AUGA SZCCT0222]
MAQTPSAGDMAGQDELPQLEAERDRLLSMIAYHNGPFYPMRSARWLRPASPEDQAPAWLAVTGIAIVCGIAILIVAGFFAGQVPASTVLFVVVGLPLLAYIFSRRVTLFGITFRAGEVLALSSEQIAGEPETLKRLADCEARIAKLKEGRSS